MFYRKRLQSFPYSEKRGQERAQLPDADCLVVQIQRPEGEVIHGELIDLTIGGAGIRVPEEYGSMKSEDLAHLLLAHPLDGWEVKTPIRLSRVTPSGEGHVLLGFQFINEGNLFAQLENAMARYFNRRHATRVTPELDEQLPVSLRWGPHRVHARAQDLSGDGLGLSVDLVSAMHLEVGLSVQVRLELPDGKEIIQVESEVRRMQRVEDRVFLGLCFEIDEQTHTFDGSQAIRDYVEKRKEEVEDWEKGFAA